MVDVEEVNNWNTFSDNRCSNFKNWIFEEGLVDLGSCGPKFTWMRGKDTDNFKGARLDRALGSVEWINTFTSARVDHLPAINFDHCPLLLHVEESRISGKG